MNEFLNDLERELLAAAQRRAARSRRRIELRDLGAVIWVADLRAMASGAMMAASVGVVAVVLAVVASSGIHRRAVHQAPSSGASSPLTRAGHGCGSIGATGGRGWRATDSAPGPQLSALLRVGRPAGAGQRRAALRDLDRTASGARSVYVRDIRVVRLSHGTSVTLLGEQSCMTVGWTGGPQASPAPQPAVVAELKSVHGVATVLLGTVAQIRSGAAFRVRTVLLKTPGGLQSVAMVPARVIRIVCHGHTRNAAVQRFPVVDHLAVLPVGTVSSQCDLIYRGSTGSNA